MTSRAQLDALVEEATVDSNGEDEQVIDLTGRNTIVAHCSHGAFRQAIDLLHLPLPTPPPNGAEWIEAYRHWAR